MYRCSKCGKKITEFDVNFSKNLFGEFDKKTNCKCAQCIADVEALEKIKENKSKTIFYLLPYIIIGGIALVYNLYVNVPFFSDAEVYFAAFGVNSWLAYVLGIICALFCLFCFFLIPPGYVMSIIKVIEDLGVKDDSYEVDVYRTTYDSSSDSFTTTKGKDYAGGPSGYLIIAGIIYPVWGIFALAIRIIRNKIYIKKNFSKEVVNAYNKAINETESIVIGKAKYDLKQKLEDDYEKNVVK